MTLIRSRPFRGALTGLAVLAVMVVLAPAQAGAQDQPREHDGGFFVRLSAGAGVANAKAGEDPDEYDFSEGSLNSNIALGGVLGENFAIHGTFMGWMVKDPNLNQNGNDIGQQDGTVALRSVGGGVTWYIMPLNLYFSGNLGVAWMSWQNDNVTIDSNVGAAIDLSIGKEWWVSDHWGLGVALGLQGFNIPLDEADGSLTGGAIAVRFSATYN